MTMSRIEAQRDLARVHELGWFLAGMDGEGPGWTDYVRYDDHPKLSKAIEQLGELLDDEKEEAPWLH